MKKMHHKSRSAAEVVIDALEEQLAEELGIDDFEETACEADDDEQIEIAEDADALDVAQAADELTKAIDEQSKSAAAELPDDEQVISCKAEDDEAEEILDACDELEKKLDACDRTAGEECPDCGKEPCQCKQAGRRSASTVKPGVEDKIGDQAHGGDPSTSRLPKLTKVDCGTDKEVFGQNSKSQYVARITARLDRVAKALEDRGKRRMAFRIDQISDALEASIRK